MVNQLRDFEIVIVHGGWSDGSCWSKVILHLRQRGIVATAAQLALNNFAADVTTLCVHIESRTARRLLLVGHSYGGAVITEVAARYGAVQALVYVTASAPVANQTFGDFMQEHPSPVPLALTPDSHGLLWAQRGAFRDALAQDLTEEEIEVLYAVQKPVASAILGASVTSEGWRVKPCWYVVAEQDRLFAPADQHALAQQIGAKVRTVPSGHLVPLRHPDALGDVLVEVAQDIHLERP